MLATIYQYSMYVILIYYVVKKLVNACDNLRLEDDGCVRCVPTTEQVPHHAVVDGLGDKFGCLVGGGPRRNSDIDQLTTAQGLDAGYTRAVEPSRTIQDKWEDFPFQRIKVCIPGI